MDHSLELFVTFLVERLDRQSTNEAIRGAWRDTREALDYEAAQIEFDGQDVRGPAGQD